MHHWELQKQDLLYSMEGCQVYATNDADLAIMEWQDPAAAELARAIHDTLKGHALCTTVVEPRGEHALVVKRIEPLGVTAVVRATRSDAAIQFVDAHGSAIETAEAARIQGMKPTRLTVVQDCSLHTARCLRAHLPAEELEIRLRFGVAGSGECMLQVPNPLECQLGSTDYKLLASHLR